MERINSLSRRRLLQFTAAGGVGAALAGVFAACGEAPEPQIIEREVPVERETVKIVEVEKVVTQVVEKLIETDRVVIKEVDQPPVPTKFNEPPMLAQRVQSGALAEVDRRLPKDPFVVKPFNEIGTYGGTLRMASVQGANPADTGNTIQTALLYYNFANEHVFDVMKNLETNADTSTWTIELREGHKWSDGSPFTADDLMWTWEHERNNTELSPGGHGRGIGGQDPTVTKVSETVVEWKYPGPAPIFVDVLGRSSRDGSMYSPAHYLEKFHGDFNPDARRLAESEGFENWTQLYRASASWGYTQIANKRAVGRPMLEPWIPTDWAPERNRYERNPYFHWVDTDGNQLPYIDRLNHEWYSNKEVYVIRATAGDIDFTMFYNELKNMPVYRDNEAEGNYETVFAKEVRPTSLYCNFNQTHADPGFRELAQNKDFRVALSISVNRQKIIDTIYFGQATALPYAPLPYFSYYEDSWRTRHLEFDPERADSMLDSLGLDKRDAEGFRLRPDGERLSILFEFSGFEGPKEEMLTLITQDMRDRGIDATYKWHLWEAIAPRVQAGDQIQMGCGHLEAGLWSTRVPLSIFGVATYRSFAPLWGQYLESNGERGEPAPDWYVHLDDLWNRWQQVQVETPEGQAIAKELFGFYVEEVPFLVGVGLAPIPVIIHNRMGNIPKEDIWFGAAINFTRPFNPPQWYINE